MASSQATTSIRSTKNAKLLSKQFSHHVWLQAMVRSGSFVRQLSSYAREHPALFATHIVGATVGVAACLAVPLLGTAGFSAAGPVAGSAAAAWQASIGVVEAGTLFAWCQSVAMGGAAMGSVVMVGALGGAVVAASTCFAVAAKHVSSIGRHVALKLRSVWRW